MSYSKDINQFYGSYSGQGIYFDPASTFLKLNAYRTNNGTNSFYSTAIQNVVDITTLGASQWYVVAQNENDGTISNITSTAGWDNWTITGNQLNLKSIYDPEKNYCRDTRSSTYYRILGVYKTSTSSTGLENGFIFNIKNEPKSFIRCNSTGQIIPNNTQTIANFGTILVDLCSEVAVGSTWTYTANGTKNINIGATVAANATNEWTQAEAYIMTAYINGASHSVLYYYMIQTTFNAHQIRATGAGNFSLNSGDYLQINIFQNNSTNLTLSASSTINFLTIAEV